MTDHVLCYVRDFLLDGIVAGCSCGWEGHLRFDYMEQVDAADEWGDHCDSVFMEATGHV